METISSKGRQIFLRIGATITWFALIIQFYLIILNRITTVPETIIRFFSFYTILTNVLVAMCFTFLLFKPNSRGVTFFSQLNVVTAITLYITVVGIIYNVILRQIWNPEGLQRLADELLHVVVPLLFIFYWLLFSHIGKIRLKKIFYWLIYPLVYVICILFRGTLSGFYPYPFIDVNVLGYNKVILNSVGLFFGFFFLSLLLAAIANARNKKVQ